MTEMEPDVFAGTHPSTPTTVDLAADLTLLLSRQALSEYAMVCEAAQRAAERCAAPDRPSADALADLGNCRASMIAAEATLKLVVDGLAARQAGKVSLERAGSELIGALICTALERLSADFEASEDEILATATRIQHLRVVLDELGVEAADARRAGRESRAVMPASASRRSLRPVEPAGATGTPDVGEALPYAGSDKRRRDVDRCRRDADQGEQR